MTGHAPAVASRSLVAQDSQTALPWPQASSSLHSFAETRVMASILQFIQEKIEYYAAMTNSLEGDESASLLNSTKNEILARITSERSCTTADAIDIISALRDSPFQSPERNEICRALHLLQNSASMEQPRGQTQRQALQSCSNVHRYFPKTLWTIVKDQEKPVQYKLACVLEFVHVQLGVSNANETTILNMLASLLLANCPNVEAAWRFSMAEAYTLLQELKAMIKAQRTKGRLPHHGKVLNYPATVKDFKELFPNEFQAAYPESLYGDSVHDLSFLPEALPFDEFVLGQFAARLPKRITHNGIAHRMPTRAPAVGLAGCGPMGPAGGFGPGRGSGGGSSNMGMLCNSMPLGLLVEEIKKQLIGGGCPGLQVFPPAPSSAPALGNIPERGTPHALQDSDQARPVDASSPSPAAMVEKLIGGPAPSPADMAEKLIGGLAPSPADMAEKLIGILNGGKGEKAGKEQKKLQVKKDQKLKASERKKKPEPADLKIHTKVIQALPYTKPIKLNLLEYKTFKIKTDLPSKCWRIDSPKAKQRCFSFAMDPKAAWDRVRLHVSHH
jgi:hypothetical protein